jgi:tetratricopeptide (TPR) repeat protein
VNIFTGAIFEDKKKLEERLSQWSERGVVAKFRERVKALEGKPPKVCADEMTKMLAEQPPESIAAEIRDALAALAERARKAQRLLERGLAREQVGYWAGAKANYNEVGTLFPDGAEDQQAHERSQAVEKLIAQADAKLREIDVAWIQNRRDQAKDDLQKLLPFNKNADAADAARQLWRRFVPNVGFETAAEQLLRDAGILEGRQQDDAARQKKLELLSLYPYSLTATRVELKVKVESIPKGAKVRVNGKAADQPTPVTVNVPASGLVRIAVEKPGYAESETALYDFREPTFLVRLVREPAERPRRLPAPAKAGLAGLRNRVALPVSGQLYLVDLAKPSAEPLERKTLEAAPPGAEGAGPPPLFGATMLPGGRGDEVELFLATSRKVVWRVTLPAGATHAVPLLGAPALPPLPFRDKALPDRLFLAAATSAGLECYDAVEGKARFPARKLGNDEKIRPTGLAFSGSRFFVASSDGKLRGWPATAGEGWEAALVPGFTAPLAAMANGDVAAAGGDGQQMAWDGKTGKARGPRDLGGKFALGLTACPKGYLALSNAGKLELVAPDGEKSLWSKELPAAHRERWPKELPPEAGALVAAVGENHAAIATPAELCLVKLADGELQWRAPLDSPPVALSVGGMRIYLSTSDSSLWVFEAE